MEAQFPQHCPGCNTARLTSQQSSQDGMPIYSQAHSVPVSPASLQESVKLVGAFSGFSLLGSGL